MSGIPFSEKPFSTMALVARAVYRGADGEVETTAFSVEENGRGSISGVIVSKKGGHIGLIWMSDWRDVLLNDKVLVVVVCVEEGGRAVGSTVLYGAGAPKSEKGRTALVHFSPWYLPLAVASLARGAFKELHPEFAARVLMDAGGPPRRPLFARPFFAGLDCAGRRGDRVEHLQILPPNMEASQTGRKQPDIEKITDLLKLWSQLGFPQNNSSRPTISHSRTIDRERPRSFPNERGRNLGYPVIDGGPQYG